MNPMRQVMSSELADVMEINPASIRRWVKEILGPDPKARRRSGYAREYSIDDAFTIIIAGYLISDLGFTISDAKKITSDMKEWLFSKGLYPSQIEYQPDGIDVKVRTFSIEIRQEPGGDFSYRYVGTVRNEAIVEDGFPMQMHVYISGFFSSPEFVSLDVKPRTLPISTLLELFSLAFGIRHHPRVLELS